MKRLFLIYRTGLVSVFIIFILLSWALIASFIAISKTNKIILIKISSDGASIINDLSSADENEQEIAFLRRFVMLMYNFDFLSFEKNINKVSFLMTNEFWLKTSQEMNQTLELIKVKKISQSSAIEKLLKKTQGQYEITLQTAISKNGEILDQKSLIKIQIKSIERSIENPWGLEVVSASEERIL